MRAFGRDLIRGGHYGQRSCEPHLKAEHMAAPTNAAYVKKALANSEPSTHGTFLPCHPRQRMSEVGGRTDSTRTCRHGRHIGSPVSAATICRAVNSAAHAAYS